MHPYNIETPCSPGDNVYLLCNDGIRLLYVSKIEVFLDYDRDEAITAICFANYPYVVLTDETKKRFFSNYNEAIRALNNFDTAES